MPATDKTTSPRQARLRNLALGRTFGKMVSRRQYRRLRSMKMRADKAAFIETVIGPIITDDRRKIDRLFDLARTVLEQRRKEQADAKKSAASNTPLVEDPEPVPGDGLGARIKRAVRRGAGLKP